MPTALITGASSGIGRASALHLAARGWTVLAGVRDPVAGERLSDEAGAGRVVPVSLDVTDAEQVAAVGELVAERHGGSLDALVNNAGVGIAGPLEVLSVDDLRRQFEVNFFGHIVVTRTLLGALRRARGRIVFVSSIGGRVAMAYSAPYAASKHAIEAVADTLRVELLSSGIQVSLIEPGAVATPIWEKSASETSQMEIPAELSAQYGHVPGAMQAAMRNTARRGVSPEVVAEAIERALMSRRPRARYLVGRDARAMLLARTVLPDRVFDRFAKRALGV